MSIAALKRKTLNGNPRLAPISGSNNGKFGFSLNGTRRNVGRVGVTNLAPGAMSGPSQMIGSTPARPTGPGIRGRYRAAQTARTGRIPRRRRAPRPSQAPST